MHRRRWAFCALAAFIVVAPAAAQMSYRVEPVVFNVTARPGQEVSGHFRLLNTATRGVLNMTFFAGDVRQNREGKVELIEGGASRAERPAARWVTIEPREARVPAGERITVRYTARVPAGARGFYPVGIVCDPIAEPARVPEGGMGLTVVIRTVLSLRLNVLSGTPQERVEVREIEVLPPEEDQPRAPIRFRVQMANTGETRVDLAPALTLLREVEETRRRVWHGAAEPRRLFPGSVVDYEVDAGRPLLRGEYTARVEASAVGRVLQRREFDLTVEGPEAGVFEGDIPIVITPKVLQVNILGGATRTAMVNITNEGDVPIRVKLSVQETAQLKRLRERYDITRSFTCHHWEGGGVQPEELVVRPLSTARARVTIAAPEGARGSYYASLVAECADEQAGVKAEQDVLVWAVTPGEVEYGAAAGDIQLADEGGGRCAFSVPVTNTGTVHITPEVSFEVLGGPGAAQVTIPAASHEGYVLREATVIMSGSGRLERLASGTYRVRAVVKPGGGAAPAVSEALLEVTWDEGKQAALLVHEAEPEADTPHEGREADAAAQ